MDVGLVRIDDLTDWTAQVYGIGELGDVADLNVDTISLDLMGCPVRAFGSVSGLLEGKVKGLFYRYRSKGEFDYVADVLVERPRQRNSPPTFPATRARSGSSIRRSTTPPRMPRMMRSRSRNATAGRWRASTGRWRCNGAVRSSSANRKRVHPVRAGHVREHGITRPGDRRRALLEHRAPRILGKNRSLQDGAGAIDVIKRTLPAKSKLRKLLLANRELVGYDDASLGKGKDFKVDRNQFVPLRRRSRLCLDRNPESATEPPQHFADLDLPGRGDFEGKTLASLCEDESNVDASVWKDFYDSFIPAHTPSPGVLPLRIWQLYREMVKAAGNGDADSFLLAAGTLAHYVGDCSQPQHGSRLDHGVAPLGHDTPEFEAFKKTPEYKIHGIYEETMFEQRPTEMLKKINDATKTLRAKTIAPDTRNGFEAALATIATMNTVRGILSPEQIIAANDPTLTANARAINFFDKLADETASCIAQGTSLLANLWLTAWKEGNGETKMKSADLVVRDHDKLKTMYRKSTNLKSLNLSEMITAGLRAPDPHPRVMISFSISSWSWYTA